MNAVSSNLNSMAASFGNGMKRVNPTILATLAIFALILWLAVSYNSETRRQNEEELTYQVVSLARSFEHDITELITRYDHLTRHISTLSSADLLDFGSVVQALYDVSNFEAYVAISDSFGNIINSTAPSFPCIRINMSDRESFSYQKASAANDYLSTHLYLAG